MWPLIFQNSVTIVNMHDVEKSANDTRDTVLFFSIKLNAMKRIKYPTVTIVKYGGLSTLFVNS